MYFELQLSAAVFGRVIRNRLRALPLGLDLSLPDPNGELVVDQVQIGDPTRVQQELAGGNFSDGFKAAPLKGYGCGTPRPVVGVANALAHG